MVANDERKLTIKSLPVSDGSQSSWNKSLLPKSVGHGTVSLGKHLGADLITDIVLERNDLAFGKRCAFIIHMPDDSGTHGSQHRLDGERFSHTGKPGYK